MPFVIFRTFLSLIIFGVLLVGIYTAFKQFSGIDIVKINLLQKDVIGLIANFIPTSVSLPLNLDKLKEEKQVIGTNNASTTPAKSKRTLLFKFILVADSHDANENLKKALTASKVEFVIGLGDYTDVGTLDELKAAKKIFDSSGIRYFVTAGDHDLWDSRNKEKNPLNNFNQVFGPSYQSFSYKNTRFLILDNSDNYLGLGDSQLSWLKEEIDRIKIEGSSQLILAFIHEPLYHPSSTRMMGKVTESLMTEAKDITKMLKEAGVKEVFAGDIHYFTRYTEPETGLAMTTIGALTDERNAEAPRYVMVSIYDDGTYDVEDVEVK